MFRHKGAKAQRFREGIPSCSFVPLRLCGEKRIRNSIFQSTILNCLFLLHSPPTTYSQDRVSNFHQQ